MPRGRPPKPTQAHILAGTFREDRHGNAPPSTGAPEIPAHLTGEAAKHWAAVVPGLVAQRIAGESDAPALAMLCEWYAVWLDGMKALRLATAGTLEASRAISVTAQAAHNWQTLASRFGLTPADRARLRVEPVKRASVATRKREA